jgi:hypothetical protein
VPYRNADKRRLGDVAVLDLDSFTWRRPAVSGATPSPREGAAAAYHAGHMVLFGEDCIDAAAFGSLLQTRGVAWHASQTGTVAMAVHVSVKKPRSQACCLCNRQLLRCTVLKPSACRASVVSMCASLWTAQCVTLVHHVLCCCAAVRHTCSPCPCAAVMLYRWPRLQRAHQ